MPELFSRVDKLNWLTPSIADILDQGSAPPGGDGSIRERMLTIQHELEELNTPAKIVNVRSTPSYTLYIARPETIGRMNNRRTISANEIKQSIKQIADNHKEWLLGFMPQLRQEDTAVGILLRTEEHRSISLRRLLVRSSFRQHPSTLAFVAGITLEQLMIVHSIDDLNHILIIGADNAKEQFIRSTLLTLIMLNTPSELRIAIAGSNSDFYKYMVGAPHALGRTLTSINDGQRLFEGLVKEIQRRKQSIKDENATDFTHYNSLVGQSGKTTLPRIILIIDSLSDPKWQTETDKWVKPLTNLIQEGAKVGIHLILTIDNEDNNLIIQDLVKQIPYRIVTRASSKDISNEIPNFHASLLRFVDAFILPKVNYKYDEITPVELCAVSNSEIKKVIEYWRQMSKQRYQNLQYTSTSASTGVTGILAPFEQTEVPEVPSAPPTPEVPSVATLARATQKLKAVVAQQPPSKFKRDLKVNVDQSNETPAVPNLEYSSPSPKDQMFDNEPDPIISHETNEYNVNTTVSPLYNQAIALAAYLGWISEGALSEIFDISQNDAGQLIIELKDNSIVEDADHPTLRFIKHTKV